MIAEIPAGTLINNRYLIKKLLGQGGFGRTYLAFDKYRFNESCVLKEFVPATNQENIILKSQELFEREAKVLYQIEHPQIPKFLASVTDGKRLFIVQEYIDGKTYSQILQERLSTQGRAFSESEVRIWLQGILPILEYIHQRKIIHRDISLDNIMLADNNPQPILIDFGVVKEKFTQLLSGNSVNSLNNNHYSLQGSVVGKIGYSPPEQLRLGYCYPSSDIYALGVSAIVLLTGRMPYLLIDESLNWQWQHYSNVSQKFANILDKMLAEKPSDRFQSASEVLLELNHQNQAQNQAPNQAPNQSKQSPINQFFQKSPLNIFQRQKTQPNPHKTNTNAPGFTQRNESSNQLYPQTPVSLNPKFLEYCQQELINFIGPFATVLMQQTLETSPNLTAEEFIEAISDAIPNEKWAQEFKNKIQLPSISQLSALQNSASQINNQQSLGNTPAIMNSEFLKHCHQELTSFIGPVAKVILEETLAQYPQLTTQELIDTLVSEIPSQERAQEFKQSIGKYVISN
ncbi:serine/threonine-protein kinase [Calothrix sp. UHCC 0171]|uniref:serine/threonine-protein kinase n=1 Tax=Calothrix sp. UHCC 0171 TaxID=3110245 RepID=UPI002B21CA3A|nr:serine/threonine-protein kinase [Calothrix sp. UHCC 0171]MEA5573891.1 serine/threonine-protein kinase [Calothrix sp. UHCC 0171]